MVKRTTDKGVLPSLINIDSSLLEMAHYCMLHQWGREMVQCAQVWASLWVILGEDSPDLSQSKRATWDSQVIKLDKEWRELRQAMRRRVVAENALSSLDGG
jgi:hypothetical protein